MFAVRGDRHDGMVVVYVLCRVQQWAVCKNNIVLCEAFLDGRRRRDNNNETGTKSEGEDMAIFLREVGECSMDGMVEEMEMAYYWKTKQRAWWEVQAMWFKHKIEGKEKWKYKERNRKQENIHGVFDVGISMFIDIDKVQIYRWKMSMPGGV